MSLGTKLKQLRQSKNWSQADVAHQFDISQAAYNKWETDQAKPNANNLMKIAEVFEVDLFDLMDNGKSVVISGNTFENFENSMVVNHLNSTISHSSELLQNVLKNQEQIGKMIEAQNKLIESLLKK